jgi:hypothetical protein
MKSFCESIKSKENLTFIISEIGMNLSLCSSAFENPYFIKSCDQNNASYYMKLFNYAKVASISIPRKLFTLLKANLVCVISFDFFVGI